MLIATRYQILDQIPSKSAVRHAVPEKPIRVATLIRREQFERTGALVHLETVFLEDHLHDWQWDKGSFRYYTRVAEVADVVLVYEERKVKDVAGVGPSNGT